MSGAAGRDVLPNIAAVNVKPIFIPYMKTLTIVAAGAFMAAPMCMVASALSPEAQQFVDETAVIMNELCDVLEKVTPATADACVVELQKLAPRIAAVSEAEKSLTQADKQELNKDAAANEKMGLALQRLMGAAMKLHTMSENASPEEKEQIDKVMQTMDAIMK